MSNIIIIGCGNMGSAFAKGFQKNLSGQHHLHIIDHEGKHFDTLKKNRSGFIEASFYHNAQTLPKKLKADALIFCVKPQVIEETLQEYTSFITPNTFALSIVAGKTVAFFEQHLPKKTAVIRSMPTLGASLGLSTTFYCENQFVTQKQSALVKQLLQSIGMAERVSEELVEKSVAHFASGLGISALFENMMLEAAVKNGFPRDIAEKAVCQNLQAITVLNGEQNHGLLAIADMVTSKGGTTQAAREVMTKKLQELVYQGMEAALKRSAELAKKKER